MRSALPILAGLCMLLSAVQPPAGAAPGAARDRPVDKAIDRGLAFLARTQDQNGAWRTNGSPNPAITSLAVMAFLSAGHVPGEGRYGETVEKGVRYVLTIQKPNGLIASEAGHEMYHHGICTLMLAEVAGMTDGQLSRDIRAAVTRAVALILKAQRDGNGRERGGWRYQVAHIAGSDISVTGWQIMALRAARNIGCDVPGENIERAVDFIKRCQDPSSGGFRYEPGSGVTIPCTGTSILALELCGKNLHKGPEVIKAGNFLLKSFPDADHWPRGGHFYYMVYYCSQATFQLGDGYWNIFRDQMHKVLLQNQITRDGNSLDGSWSDPSYGPAYATSMAILALTVEYRFLPIYQRSEEPAPGASKEK
jgi:hypothetical protein